jgi:hypothetical protein
MSETVPLDGRTLILGPSGVGKTRRTARALGSWLDEHGSEGVVVFEFAPELERDGEILGGRLTRFRSIPDDVWYGKIDAHAPRAESGDEGGAVALAERNAQHAAAVIAAAPSDPRAVFVNDATIPFQHGSLPAERLLDYCENATCVVCNAFDSDELGTDDPVSRQERHALSQLSDWAGRVVRLEKDE